MKKLKKLVTIMIIMVTAVLTVNAQVPNMIGSPVSQPAADGKYYLDPNNFLGSLQIWDYTSNSYTTRSTRIAYLGYDAAGYVMIGMKYYFYYRIVINTTVAANNTIRVKANAYSGGGNYVYSTDGTDATIFKRLTWPTKNGAQYDTFNINDKSRFKPAVFNGDTNYVYYEQLFMLDSIGVAQLNANGRFFYKFSIPLEILQYPSGSSPYRGIYHTDGVMSSDLGVKYSYREEVGTKRVSAYFADTVLTSPHVPTATYGYPRVFVPDSTYVYNGTTYYVYDNYISASMDHFPSNSVDSANSRQLFVKLFEVTGSGDVFVNQVTKSSYWDIVDEIGTGQSRADMVTSFSAEFNNVKDNTNYKIVYGYRDGSVETVYKTFNIRTNTMKKRVTPIVPVFTDLIIKSKTTNTVTVNLSFTRGNVDTFPIVLQLRDSSGGSPLLDTTVSVFGTGSASFDITKTNLLASRGYFMQVLQNGVILKTIGFRTLDIVSVETDPVLVSVDVIDIDSEQATAVITVTTGNKAGSAAVLNVAIDGGGIVNTGTIPIEATTTPQTVIKTFPLTGLKSEQDYACSATLSGKTLTKSFKTSVSTSSISAGASVTGVSAYIDGSGMLQTTGVSNRVTKELYSFSGARIAQFNESLDMNIYPSGIYFLVIDGQSIKFIK